MKYTEEVKEECKKSLQKLGVKKESEIYSYVRSVTPSGMSRQIKFFLPIVRDGKLEIVDITAQIAKINDSRFNSKNSTIVAQGCGMDMCFNEVYNLAYNIFHSEAEKTGKGDAGYWLKSANLN
jgi:hypothetical protein